MAEKTEFLQAIDDAILDADSLEQFINGSDDETVLTRLSAEYPTLQKAIKELFENGGLPATPFKTKALMEASALVDGDYAQVTDDTDNNGLYVKTAGFWVKSEYDPVLSAFTSLSLPDNLNNIVSKGVYFVDGETAYSASRGNRSYPSGLSTNPAVIVVGKDKDGNVVQSLTQSGMTFTRSFTPDTNVVVNEWSSSNSIGVKAFASITNGFKAVAVGEVFIVYPNDSNTLLSPTYYKKTSNTDFVVLYEKQAETNPLDGLLIQEGEFWEVV